MYPILFSFGPVTVYSFGLFLFLAFFAAIFTIWLHGRREGFDEEQLLDGCLFVSLWGVIGGRLGYFFAHWKLFSLANLIFLWRFPGFSWLAAMGVGLAGLWVFSRRNKLDFPKLFDLIVLGLALGEALGRIGAFFSGTAYGKPTNLFWGVFQVGLLEKRHPVQLLSAGACLAIGIILLRLKKKRRFAGFLGLAFLGLRGGVLFWLEFLKEGGVYWGRVKLGQAVAFLVAVGATVLIYQKKSFQQDLENAIGRLVSLGGKVHLRLSRLRSWLGGKVKRVGKINKEQKS